MDNNTQSDFLIKYSMPSSIQPDAYLNQSNLIMETLNLIKQLDIKLIAFDFDCTLVNIHTGGQWLDSAEKLAEFVRPCFRDLLPVLLKCNDLYTCVVTYSPQEKLIRDVLKISMKDEQDINNLVDKIIIKGNTKEFLNQHGLEACYTSGKELHLDYCKSYLDQYKIKIENSNILLIDDDVTNLKTAENYGHYTFQVQNNMNLKDLVYHLKNYC